MNNRIKLKVDNSTNNKRKYVFLWVIAIFSNIKSIFADYGQDSSYALVTSARHILGDRMIEEMWEPHQMSTFVIDIFLAPFYKLTGSFDYSVLYLQIIGSILILGTSLYLYSFLKKRVSFSLATCITLIYLVSHPKGVVFPEFSNLMLLFSVYMLANIVKYLENEASIKPLLGASLFMSLGVLSYPGFIIIFPIGVAALIIMTKHKMRSVLIFSSPAVFCGVATILYFICTRGFSELLGTIESIINSDLSHTEKAYISFSFYEWAIYSGVALIVIFVISFVLHKIKNKIEVGNSFIILTAMVYFIAFTYLENQREYVAFGNVIKTLFPLLIVAGICGYKYCNETEKRLFLVATIISVSTMVGVLILTNLILVTVFNYGVLGAAFSLIPIYRLIENKETKAKNPADFAMAIVILLILENFYHLVDYSGARGIITKAENIVRQGPAAGIVCTYMKKYETACDIEDFSKYVTDYDKLLVVGNSVDSITYLYTKAEISTPSVISTPSYGEWLIDYWEKYDKKPTVIAVSCWYGDMQYDENSWIMDYIGKNLDSYIDGRYWRFYRMQ